MDWWRITGWTLVVLLSVGTMLTIADDGKKGIMRVLPTVGAIIQIAWMIAALMRA